jgi:hypothetical protein
LIKCGVPQVLFWDHCCSCCTSTTYPSVLKIQDLGYSLMIQTSQPLVTP